MGTWNFRTIITGLTNDLLGVNLACKPAAFEKELSRLHMDEKKFTSLWQGKSAT